MTLEIILLLWRDYNSCNGPTAVHPLRVLVRNAVHKFHGNLSSENLTMGEFLKLTISRLLCNFKINITTFLVRFTKRSELRRLIVFTCIVSIQVIRLQLL